MHGGMSETDRDEQQRLWTPWRMGYVGGERRPTPPGVSIFSAIAADPAHDAENFVLHRGARAFVVMNLYPYNTGHCMVVPYRQVATLDALDTGEMTEIGLLLPWLTRVLQTTLRCDGLNLGLNLGAVAGAGVAEHLHWHVVPRWQGDANFMPIIAQDDGDAGTVAQYLRETARDDGYRPCADARHPRDAARASGGRRDLSR